MATDPDAPTLTESLAKRGVHGRQAQQARLALLDWLGTWRGSTPEGWAGDRTLDYLERMAGIGR